MDCPEVYKLADTLHEHGENVLSGQSKFILTTAILSKLNHSISEILDKEDVMSSSFHVKFNSPTKMELIAKLLFLQDFMRKTKNLKLIAQLNNSCSIDITNFTTLEMLEVHKINVLCIKGFNQLLRLLKFFTCTKGTNTMKEILMNDAVQKYTNLRELSLTYCNLKMVQCLELIPNLLCLDLSHNQIENADDVHLLVKLKQLNLGYNKLKSIPKLTTLEFSTKLEVLIVCNNFIEEIVQIVNLTNLRELDLSENCLIEHNLLLPLSNIATLQLLNLNGNPLSYHPQHRLKTAQCLNKNIATVKFILDRNSLTKSENLLVGLLHPRLKVSPTTPYKDSQAPVKPRRIRNVVISDAEYSPQLNLEPSTSLTASMDHLDTRRKIEQLKTKYGNNWLQEQPDSLLQSVSGTDEGGLVATSTPYGSTDLIGQSETKSEIETTEAYITALDVTITSQAQEVDYDKQEKLDNDKQDNDKKFYQEYDADESSSPSEDGNFGDGEENVFLLTIAGKGEPVFFVITGEYFTEIECTSAKELAKWSVESLEKWEQSKEHLTLYFDTFKVDSKIRKYDRDAEESTKLLESLKKIMDSKTKKTDTEQQIFSCFKCASQFSVDKQSTAATFLDSDMQQCPNCSSKLVFKK